MTVRENFPVGSRLIRRDLRGAVHAFYRVARAADDIADDPALAPAERLAGLDHVEAGLAGDPAGAPEALALAALGRPGAVAQARALLVAFRRDARDAPCRTWGDLLDYCEHSANPVGRFLLDLHGEGRGARPLSDALCTALQVLNHLQDLGDDHRVLGRHYLPLDWIAGAGASTADLSAPALSPALRGCVDRALDGCDGLLDMAAGLPGALASRRLAGEAAAILALARGLAARLRRADPLAARVAPTRADFGRAALAGAWVALGPRTLPRRAEAA